MFDFYIEHRDEGISFLNKKPVDLHFGFVKNPINTYPVIILLTIGIF